MPAVPSLVLTGTTPGTELTGKHYTALEISLTSATPGSGFPRAVAPKPACASHLPGSFVEIQIPRPQQRF